MARSSGGLLGLVGKGVAMGAEYREHRKGKKQASAASDQAIQPATLDGPSDTNSRQAEVLPAYSDLPSSTERQIESGTAATEDKKTESSSEEDIESDDLYSDTDTEYYSVEDDEELIELDDALYPADSKDLPSYEESEAHYQPVEELVREVMSTSRPPITTTPSERPLSRPQLPFPVVLPQRRPRKHARGFIRAYSPVLADCGISQDVFLKFLKNFHKSSQASPIFPVIQISAAIASLAPSIIAMAVCTVAQVGAGIGAEVQSRARTNNFLDIMNVELFKPAGLYAMIVKYKFDEEVQQSSSGLAGLASQIRAETVDVSTNHKAMIAKYNRSTTSDDPTSKTMSDRVKNLRLASGTTKGAAMLPESAPLIFPDIDQKVAHAGGPETFKDKTKDAKKFLADYLDRRAQMEYASQDPSSSLSVPEQQRGFKTTIADPNHPMHSGGLIALVSGGKVAPRMQKRERRMERTLARDETRIARGREPRARKRYGDAYQNELAQRVEGRTAENLNGFAGASRDVAGEGSSRNAPQYRAVRRGRGNRKGALGAVRRVMREDVLYLMIVNLPDERELAEARMELDRSQRY